MRFRLQKALLAVVFALSFILNGSAMQLAHADKPAAPAAMNMASGAMPCDHAMNAEKHHPCCPQQGQDKASCTADCCTSVLPMMTEAAMQVIFVKYLPRAKPALVLSSRTLDPPSRPPQV
jgi:hypothetical protein